MAELPMPRAPVDDPADWRGPALEKSHDWIHHLEPAEIEDLGECLRAVQSRGLRMDQITRADFALPVLAPKLARIRREVLHGRGFVMIRGLPVERYSKLEAAILYWGIGMHLGQAVSQNAKGHLLGHVRNLGHSMTNTSQRGYASTEALRYHIDEADIVGLLCLQPSMSGGESTIVSSIAIHNAIMQEAPELLRLLYQPYYIDRRGEVPEGAKPYYPMPIFAYHEGKLTTWLSPQYTTSSQRFDEVPRYTQAQWDAMHLVEKLADDPRFRLNIAFGRGDIQFLNNYVVLHSRTEYQEYPEPERKRHLLRLWLAAPDARPLPPFHVARYGDDRRGGVYVPGMVPNVSIDLD